MEYSIEWNGNKVGTADMLQQGLYTVIDCRCNKLDGGFHRLSMVFSDRTVDLGVLIQDGGFYVARKKIPTKSLGVGNPTFCVLPVFEKDKRRMIRLDIGQPIQKLERIREGKFVLEAGTAYLQF